MSRTEHFDIVQDEEPQDGGPPPWLWVGLIALVAVFAFVVGIAYNMVANRVSDPPVVVDATNTPEAVAIGDLTTTPAVTPAAETETPTPTPSPTITPTPTPTPTVNCVQPVDPAFQSLYLRDYFGCATSPANIVWAAWEPFERGSMLWRNDTDTAYVFRDNGQWFIPDIRWDGSEPRDRGAPPPGLRAPEHGFGYVWGHSDDIFNALGWALDIEKGFCATVQNFDQGFILQSSNVPSCTPDNLYNHATAGDWQVVTIAATIDGIWYNSPFVLPQPTPPAPTAADLTRPPANGLFFATAKFDIELDGNLDEWKGNWMPIHAVVYGADSYEGPQDLSGNFLLGWTPQALCMAVRVNDDHYRAGPTGTDMWQGDSLEIQLDRDLPGDFLHTQADGDDHQIGIGFGRNLDAILGYHWLPFEHESTLAIPGVVTETRSGYDVEICLAWSIFGIDGNALRGGEVFGFNISISDNDSNRPAQQTIVSASAQRTRHDNPTEWGTLTLIP